MSDLFVIPLLIIGLGITIKSYETYQMLPINKEGKSHRQQIKEEHYVKYFGIFLIVLAIVLFFIGSLRVLENMM